MKKIVTKKKRKETKMPFSWEFVFPRIKFKTRKKQLTIIQYNEKKKTARIFTI